ncbi:Mu transposase domain-containing protein [Actinoplanes sp. NPDC020271]|uniref:Mu transposase domain-containing protein n=1 Tax=Actinoplanes sp. NPDC020271 TaxID=3363896 RepID=UPI0037A971AC
MISGGFSQHCAPVIPIPDENDPSAPPLPVTAFTLAEWSRSKVAPDVHVKCGKTLYSVPWRLIRQLVDIRATATMVQIFQHGELVKTHVCKDKGRAMDVADHPPEKIAFHTRTPQWCRERAEQTGLRPPRVSPSCWTGRLSIGCVRRESNARALAFCQRIGFRTTRKAIPYRPHPVEHCHIMEYEKVEAVLTSRPVVASDAGCFLRRPSRREVPDGTAGPACRVPARR